MPAGSTFLSLGSPTFADPDLTERARSSGLRAAWLAALDRGPEAAASAARGGFAVGITLDDGRAFAAVDRFAIQTLCLSVVDGRLRFAARADEVAGADADPDPQALFNYLYFHAIPSPGTVFKGVHRVPPGHYAWWDGRSLKVAPYWTPTFEEPRRADFNQARERFLQILQDGVASALDGGKPGCFLSGGTDSSTVAGMISRVSNRQAATYSIGFDAQGYDEMAFARIAARHFGTEHHEYYVTPSDLVQQMAEVAASYDQPFGNSSALPAYFCAKMARDDGVTRLLAGDGGDELFGGNSRYAKQRVFGWYGGVPSLLKGGLLEPVLGRSAIGRLPGLRKGASYIEQARVPMPDRLQMYNLILRLGTEQVLTPAFLAQVQTEAPITLQREVWRQCRAGSETNRTLAYDWRFTLAESDLPKVRGTSTLAGIEVGFPMLDDALLEFSLGLPVHYKLRGLKLRWFFKEALRGFLPDEILTKKKQGFGLPFGVWACRHEALKALTFDAVRAVGRRGLVREDFIRQLLEVHLPAHPGYYGEMVWILSMLEFWLQRHAPDWRVAG
jgi:asparagine synthase (glutamine-hydrolysing)